VAKNLPKKPNLKKHNHAFQDKNNVTGDKELVDPLVSTIWFVFIEGIFLILKY
jgi:hypothetical protein